MSLTGLSCIPINNSLQLFRQNSLGDIFCQVLHARRDRFEKRLSDDDLELLKDWKSQCAKAIEVPDSLYTTNTLNLNKLFTVTSDEKAEVREWSEVHPSTPRKMKSKRAVENWQLSKQFLEDCVDVFASKLLSVWDIEDEDEWADLEEQEKGEDEEEDPTQKVRSWLDSAPMTFDTGIPGIEPLREEGIHTDEETYNKKEKNFSTTKAFLCTKEVNRDKHVKHQSISRLTVDDNFYAKSAKLKRQLSMPPFLEVVTRGCTQLTPVLKKTKLHDKELPDILDKVSVKSLSLPKRKFPNIHSPGRESPNLQALTKLHNEYNTQSDQSYPLTQKVLVSQRYGNKSSKHGTPLKMRNVSPIMFGSELGSVKNASITSKSRKEINTTPITKMSQYLSSQHDMFAGPTPQRFQSGTDFPVTPSSSQKHNVTAQKPQSAKKIFVTGF